MSRISFSIMGVYFLSPHQPFCLFFLLLSISFTISSLFVMCRYPSGRGCHLGLFSEASIAAKNLSASSTLSIVKFAKMLETTIGLSSYSCIYFILYTPKCQPPLDAFLDKPVSQGENIFLPILLHIPQTRWSRNQREFHLHTEVSPS